MTPLRLVAGRAAAGLALALAALAPLPALAAPIGTYDVTAGPIAYDRATNRTTYTYEVVGGGSGHDLSHFTIALAPCVGGLVDASPANATLGLDPTTGLRGVKWDGGLRTTERRTYSFTVDGLWAPTDVTAAIKASTNVATGPVTGPSCEPAAPAVRVVKTAGGAADGADLIAHAGPVAFTYRVENTGNMPLDPVVVVDDNGTAADPTDDFTVGTIALARGESAELTATRPIEADYYRNVAGATGTVAPDWTVAASDDATVDVIHPAISVAQSCPTSAFYGEAAGYRVTVKNTGDTPLAGVSVGGDLLGTLLAGGTLAVGEERAFDAAYAAPAGAASPLVSRVTASGDDVLALTVTAAAACEIPVSARPVEAAAPAVESKARTPKPTPAPATAETGTVAARTIGYWKNHAWPVQSLAIGGETLTRAQALKVLQGADAKDATLQLAAQLVGAKLNVANGATHVCVDDAIAAADAFLSAHPRGSNPRGVDRDAALALMDRLDRYNNQGCA